MKKRMEHLLAGKFKYELPQLMFSKEKISVSLKSGETVRGEVYFGTEENQKIRGYITSSSRRLVPGVKHFQGTTMCLPYGIDAVGLAPGEVRREWLTFTSSIGEYRLPFEIRVEEETVRTRSGQISNMQEFTQFAEQNFREAFRLFADKSFLSILQDVSVREKALYAGLTAQPVTYQHLEEYLIASGQKEPVKIALLHDHQEVFRVKENVSQSVPITKSDWGHLRLEVETEGDFLEVEKRVITDEEFIGRNYSLTYVIHADQLSEGIRYGKIRISSPYETLVYEVSASKSAHSGGSVRLREQKMRLTLLKDYLEYVVGETELSAWAVSTHYELNQLTSAGFDDVAYRLYEVFLCYKEGKIEEAKVILKDFQSKSFSKDDLEMAGAYLYLCSAVGLYKDRMAALQRIQNFYSQKQDSFVLLYALMQLDPVYQESPSKKLYAMEELFERGCKNPILYAEAWNLVKNDESLFHRISPFWIQVLLFAGRRDLLTEEMVMRFSYLAGYEKEFNESLYRALSYGCDAYPNADTTEAICRYLMLGNPRKPEYFHWYERAVEYGIRLTRLYEYYVETMDTSYHTDLPKSLLMYFTYNNSSLGDSRKAFLYATVIANKDRDPELYANYRKHMEEFADRKLREGKISEDYAAIYQDVLTSPKTEEEARGIAAQLFTNRLYCDNPKIRSVIVRHNQLAREEIYPCVQGIAYPKLYTEDAAILFLDENQRRYGVTINYNLKKLLDERDLPAEILARGVCDPGVLLNYCENAEICKENLSIFQKLVQSEAFTPEYRKTVRKRILDFYVQHVHGEDLDDYLNTLDYREYALVDKAALLEILVSRRMFRQAFAIVEEFGTEGMDVRSLLKLTSRMILKSDFAEDEELIALASEVYREGFYDEVILKYLMIYRYGPVDDLLKILKSAQGFEMDTYEWEERILEMLMFTQDYRKEGEQVLEQYVHHHGKERIIGAYLCQLSYGIFVLEYRMSDYVEECLMRAYRSKWPVHQVCHLALFKALCQQKKNTPELLEIKKDLLEECVKAGYVFSFFRKLPAELLSPYQLDDKMYVEVHAAPDAKVTLYYRLDNGLGLDEEYQTVPLSNMYEGIFTKTFTLFYGENLHYWFQIEKEGKVRKTSARVVTMNHVEGTPVSKYQQINQILSARKLGKDQEVQQRLKTYLRQQQYVQEMFTIDREA